MPGARRPTSPSPSPSATCGPTAGLTPSILEYLDAVTMVGISRAASLEFGVADEVTAKAAAWLVVLLETRTEAQLDADTESAATLLADLGALDVYVLPPASAKALIEAT